MLRIVNFVLLTLILSFELIISNSATVLAGELDQRYYLGFQASNIWIKGDFDGLEENIGGGLLFGATNDIYTCEISYSQSKHDVLDFSPKSTAELESLNLGVKVFAPSLKNKKCRPYGLAGWGITKFSIDFSTLGYGDVKYDGNGFHLGFGMNCMINKKMAIDGSIAYYRYSINKIKYLVYEDEPPKDDVKMIKTITSLGLQYYF